LAQKEEKKMSSVQTGLENLLAHPPAWLGGRRLGLLCNPASVDRRWRHARDLIQARFPGRLKALYSPQHGFFAEKQDNMIESDHITDPVSGLPVFSLYGQTRVPTEEMLAPIDVLLVDLQDVGTRVYTFVYTVSYCLEAARKYGKRVAILDRPNPIGGLRVEGNCLQPETASFVGRYPIPMRHGLTLGEIAGLFNQAFGIGCDLAVVPLTGWQRWMDFAATGLPWVPPSPNLPTSASALVYPGQVLWEGTNVSEGRGGTQPFEVFGAPFFNTRKILAAVEKENLAGVWLRPLVFEPTASKWAGSACHGFQLHITDPARYHPYETTLELLRAVLACHPTQFAWRQPPYEYEFEKLPIVLLTGDPRLHRQLEAGMPVRTLAAAWEPELNRFKEMREAFLIYR
jgi:uncharacterized protein YbbC (DUF1343 family)